MTKTEDYRAMLRSLAEWEPYLLAQSGYPLEHAENLKKNRLVKMDAKWVGTFAC